MPRPKSRKSAAPEDPYYSKVVGKALEALETLKKSDVPISLNDLSQRLDSPKSSIFRVLHTLEVAGYVEKDAAGLYLLSSDARSAIPTHFVQQLIRTATPHMKDLQARYPETISLGVLFDTHLQVVEVLESPQIVRMGNTVGRILPPHASSLGKVLTAFRDAEERSLLIRSYGLHKFTERTIVDEVELEDELERVRTEGYAADREENAPGGYCFGVPIHRGAEVSAAMSLSLPQPRLPGGGAKDLVAALKGFASKISHDWAGKGSAKD